MQIYLPIAELAINIMLLLSMGGAVGFLAGMFGVGGGFLITPLLIFTGVAPCGGRGNGRQSGCGVVGVRRAGAFPARQQSTSSWVWCCWRAASQGRWSGVFVFRQLRVLGYLDAVVSLAYVLFPGRGRRADADRKRAHAAAAQPRPGPPALRKPGPAWLDPRSAVQDPVQALEDLCQRLSGSAAGRVDRISWPRSWAWAAASSWCRR
jgi:hypothetical protein